MWTRSSSRSTAPAPISDAVPGRRGSNARDLEPDGDPPKRPIGGTALALVLGIVLMGAALLLPSSDAPDAVPGDGLQPVSAATTDPAAERDGASPEAAAAATSPDESWQALDGADSADDDHRGAADDGPSGSTARATGAAGDPDGSSSASVAGDDIDRAAREDAQRQRAARRKAKARRAARARQARAKRDRSQTRQRATAPPAASSAAPSAPASAPPSAASSAPPRAAPARSAPRRSPSKNSPSREFAGGL